MKDQVNEALETLTQYSAEHGHPADFEAAISTLSVLAHPSRGVVDEVAERRALNKALDALDALSERWASEIGLDAMCANLAKAADVPAAIRAMAVQAWVEGAYAGRTSHQAAALPAAPTRNMEQVRSEAFNLADTVIEWIESGNVQAARDAIRDSLVAHAAPPAVPDTWQERLRAEYAELDERFTKLCAFLESERFASLHEDDRRILMAQGNGMRAYLNALTFRVDQLDYAATPAHDQPEGEG